MNNQERVRKNIEKRVSELKEHYSGVSDFDFYTIAGLEAEFVELSKTNPEHTKRRRELLDM